MNDWGGGDWWEIWPPPPGEDENGDWIYDEDNAFLSNIPPVPDSLDFENLWQWGGSVPDQYLQAFSILTDISQVDPRNIRGIGFQTPYEAYQWLQATGLFNISKIVEQSGLFYPVVGEYDDDDAEDLDPGSPFDDGMLDYISGW